MAVYDCDYGRHRYPQPQQSIYYTHVIGSSMDSYKMRLCPSHFRASVVCARENMAVIDEDTQSSSSCERCHGDKVGALYAKVYPSRDEPIDLVADLCAACLSDLGNELRIFNGHHRTGPSAP